MKVVNTTALTDATNNIDNQDGDNIPELNTFGNLKKDPVIRADDAFELTSSTPYDSSETHWYSSNKTFESNKV